MAEIKRLRFISAIFAETKRAIAEIKRAICFYFSQAEIKRVLSPTF